MKKISLIITWLLFLSHIITNAQQAPDDYMIIQYDDGTMDDALCYAIPVAYSAVRFTPPGHPAPVIGGKIYVPADFPIGSPIIGTKFSVAIFDDDGPQGLPGTLMDSISITVENTGWISFTNMYAVIFEGDFYISMIQVDSVPDICAIGIDQTMPTYYRSYSKPPTFDKWELSAYQDFMIAAFVEFSTSFETLEPESSNELTIYPNPAKNSIKINIANWKNITNKKLEIFSMHGIKILAEIIPDNLSVYSLKLPETTEGLYIVVLSSENKILERERLLIVE